MGTDFIDLYQVHRWDRETPLEETLEALDSVVRAGKVRYLGASSMWAWQFSKALHTAGEHGWHRFVSMQDHYNLLNREEEREMLPLCADQGIGVIPWSPLARGRLTRDWDETTNRSSTDDFGKRLYDERSDRAIVERVAEVARERGISRAQVALAWVLAHPVVTAPIVGVTKDAHLDDAVAAVDVQLTDEEVARLEESYTPARGRRVLSVPTAATRALVAVRPRRRPRRPRRAPGRRGSGWPRWSRRRPTTGRHRGAAGRPAR